MVHCKSDGLDYSNSDRNVNERSALLDLRNFPQVKHLDLSFNSLSTTPSEAFSALTSTLTHLNLSNNALEVIKGLEALRCLKSLDLSSNKIEELTNIESNAATLQVGFAQCMRLRA